MQTSDKSGWAQFWARHSIATVGWLAIVANLLIVLFLFHIRNNYHIDELFSFVHANSSQGVIIPSLFQWHPGTLFHNWLTVQLGETFHYQSIWKNLALDVHPPLFYILLHTVCSFTPDVFSKWHGAMVNIPLWLLLLWRLFKLSKLFFKESFYAWCVVLLYAYSEVGLDTVLFIRGYLLQTLLAVCLVEQVTRILQENQASIGRWLCIGGITTLGMLTHYNFLPFAALVGILAGIILCTRKEWQLCWRLGITLTAGFALFVALFPPAIDVIINSRRGKEAFANYAGNPIWSFIRGMDWKTPAVGYLTCFWQGSARPWFFFYAGVLSVLAYKYLRTKAPRLIDWVLALAAMTGMYAVFTMPKNMGVYGIRYTMFIYPLAALVTVWYMSFIVKRLIRRPRELWQKRVIGLLVIINSLGAWSFAQASPFTFRMLTAFPTANLREKRVIIQGDMSALWVGTFSHVKEVYWMPIDAPLEKISEALKSADVLVKRSDDPLSEQLSHWQMDPAMYLVSQNQLVFNRTFYLGFWPYDEYLVKNKMASGQLSEIK